MKSIIILITIFTSLFLISCGDNVSPYNSVNRDWEGNYPNVNTGYSDYVLFASDRLDGTGFAPSIYMMKKDGTGIHALTNYGFTFRASWSPRRWKIICITDAGLNDQELGLYTMNYDGTNITRITPKGEQVYGAEWSPDGQTIAFIELDTSYSYERGRIKLINPDGTNVRTITDWFTAIYKLSWSPDSKRLIFDGVSGRGKGQINIINSDGSGLATVFTYPYQCLWPAWSPDGNLIAFCSFSDIYYSHIFAYDFKAQRVLQVTSGKSFDYDPTWSSDSKSILFSSAPPGINAASSIYSVNINGSDLIRLTDSSGTDYNVSWNN